MRASSRTKPRKAATQAPPPATSPPPTAAAPDTTTSGMAGVYQARPSQRTVGMEINHDGVVWKERLAVVEGVTPEGNPQLHLRSYFRDATTHERVWDEPPSGASHVEFATPAMRNFAQEQMRELQFTLDLIPPDSTTTAPPGDTTSNKKKGFFRRPGVFKKKEKATLQDESKDLNLQRAIALSMADQQGPSKKTGRQHKRGASNASWGGDDPRILFDSEFSQPVKSGGTRSTTTTATTQEEEDLAMAKALSLSAAEQGPAPTKATTTKTAPLKEPLPHQKQQAPPRNQQNNHKTSNPSLTEDEMLQLAIEQSKQDMYGVQPVESQSKPSTAGSQLIGPYDPYSSKHVNSPTTRSSTPTTDVMSSSEGQPELHKIQDATTEPLDRKKPARSLSRRMFGGRKRMEAQAGVL
uniref:Uncharacterized protein n=1 Tax=Entomoneis paludosa TaxID=265537 RepID=A0A7S2VBC6_9STRA